MKISCGNDTATAMHTDTSIKEETRKDPTAAESRNADYDLDDLDDLFKDQLLVSKLPSSVWGVLLSLSPDDYKTIRLERQQHEDSSSGPESRRGRGRFGYRIGRHKKCDIRIMNPHVSNQHCLIYRVEGEDGGATYLEDTSTNGTYINNRRMTKHGCVQLRDGDEIQLVKYQPAKGMKWFNDRFFKFQDLKVHRSNPHLFAQNYLLDGDLGKGAFAQVKVAVNRATGERFAAKIIDRKKLGNGGVMKPDRRKKVDMNFQIETSILSRVRHPSIVQVHGVFREPDMLYLVLDLARDGELFDEIVCREYLSEDDARRVALQLLLAVRHLHRAGIAHRDIKLENILLADKPSLTIKLADFGLAKIVGEERFMQTVCGTPMYVAPEVLGARQKGRQYDKQVDMWSLGVVLYICLCGFPPFSDELSPPPMRDQIVKGIYGFPEPHWSAIDPDAVHLVRHMLDVNPATRITVDEALAHPWLRAYVVDGVWAIAGIAGFAVVDPDEDALTTPQRTQSVVESELSKLGSSATNNHNSNTQLSPYFEHPRPSANAKQCAGKNGDDGVRDLPPSSPPDPLAAYEVGVVIKTAGDSSSSSRVGGPVFKYPAKDDAPANVFAFDSAKHAKRKRNLRSFSRSDSELRAKSVRRGVAGGGYDGHEDDAVSGFDSLQFRMSPDCSAAIPNGSEDVYRKGPPVVYPDPIPRPGVFGGGFMCARQGYAGFPPPPQSSSKPSTAIPSANGSGGSTAGEDHVLPGYFEFARRHNKH